MPDIVIKSENLFWEDKNGGLTSKHFRPVITENENINNVVSIDGRFILAQDTGRMYYDNNGKRIELGNAGLDYVKLVGSVEEATKNGVIYVLPSTINNNNSVFDIYYNKKHIGSKTLSIDNSLYSEKANFNVNYIKGNTSNVTLQNSNAGIAFGLKDGTKLTVAGYKAKYIPINSGTSQIFVSGNNLVITLNDGKKEGDQSLKDAIISIDGGNNYPYFAKVINEENNTQGLLQLTLEPTRGKSAANLVTTLIDAAKKRKIIYCSRWRHNSY